MAADNTNSREDDDDPFAVLKEPPSLEPPSLDPPKDLEEN